MDQVAPLLTQKYHILGEASVPFLPGLLLERCRRPQVRSLAPWWHTQERKSSEILGHMFYPNCLTGYKKSHGLLSSFVFDPSATRSVEPMVALIYRSTLQLSWRIWMTWYIDSNPSKILRLDLDASGAVGFNRPLSPTLEDTQKVAEFQTWCHVTGKATTATSKSAKSWKWQRGASCQPPLQSLWGMTILQHEHWWKSKHLGWSVPRSFPNSPLQKRIWWIVMNCLKVFLKVFQHVTWCLISGESFHAPGHPDRPYVQATELKLGVSWMRSTESAWTGPGSF